MSFGKQNQLQDFSKLLKKLQMENVSLPELRILKQEHFYLEKLRQQRLKIQELKGKYDESQKQCSVLMDQNRQQISKILHKIELIENQSNQISIFEEKIKDLDKKKNQLENSFQRQVDQEKQRQRQKIGELVGEIQNLKKELKQKDIDLFNLETDFEEKDIQFKDQITQERRKIWQESDQRIKKFQEQVQFKHDETVELRELVMRQHKALQLQSQQFQEIISKNEAFAEDLQKYQELAASWEKQKEDYEDNLCDLNELNQKLKSQLSENRCNLETKDQIDEIRKKMSQLTKGEIEKIEFIVNEFD